MPYYCDRCEQAFSFYDLHQFHSSIYCADCKHELEELEIEQQRLEHEQLHENDTE